MEWINEKAKTLKQGAIRAMFDRANTMTGVISLGIGEPDMPTPKLVCEAAKEALDSKKEDDGGSAPAPTQGFGAPAQAGSFTPNFGSAQPGSFVPNFGGNY